MTLRSTTLLLAALTLTACKQSTPTPAATNPAPATTLPTAPPVNPATAGTITGTVTFTGKPPARIPIDMSADPTMHNIHTTPTDNSQPIDISQSPMGASDMHRFNTPETMLPVRCNNHPWMQAFINVAPNPSFAVTDANGHFTLPDLPPGTYTLAAVHEKLGEQDIQITVAPKATAQASFTFNAQQPPH